MSLSMYLGEVDTQMESINSFCKSIIQTMEQVIQSIDEFSQDTMLKGKTYDSAKIYFSRTYKVIAKGMICLCEEFIRQNEALTRNFRSQVASSDVIEEEIREQIFHIQELISDMNNLQSTLPSMNNMVEFYEETKRKLQQKLEHLYEFNQSSSGLYNNVIELISSISRGLEQLSYGKTWTTSLGVFNIAKLDMNWTQSIENYWHDREKNKKSDELEISNEYDKIANGLSSTSQCTDISEFLISNSRMAMIAKNKGFQVITKVIQGNSKQIVIANEKALELAGIEFSRSKVSTQIAKHGGVPLFDHEKGVFTKYGRKLVSEIPSLKPMNRSWKSVGKAVKTGVKSGVEDVFSLSYKNLGVVEGVGKGLSQAGVGLAVAGNTIDALNDGFQVTDIPRVTVDTAIDFGVGTVAIEGGAAIGTLICPGIGTVIGAGIGFLANVLLNTDFTNKGSAIDNMKGNLHRVLRW